MTSAATDAPPLASLTIGILGGTGEQGRGLARRFGLAGLPVLLGSRTAERAAEAASGLAGVRPCLNAEAAEGADVVIVAVPWEGHGELLHDLAPQLAGKLVVDCVNPLTFGKGGPWRVAVPEGSAAQQAATLLPESRVVAAFHHISAKLLLEGDDPVETDVLVAGDVREDKDVVIALASSIAGMRGIDAGPLHLASALESMTAVLIAVNRRYKAHAGVRITDV